jgi:hypothetical protein
MDQRRADKPGPAGHQKIRHATSLARILMMRSFRTVSVLCPKVQRLYLYHEDFACTQAQQSLASNQSVMRVRWAGHKAGFNPASSFSILDGSNLSSAAPNKPKNSFRINKSAEKTNPNGAKTKRKNVLRIGGLAQFNRDCLEAHT